MKFADATTTSKIMETRSTLRRTRGKGWKPLHISEIFGKEIYSKGLKLSVAVRSSSAEILTGQWRLSILALPWQPQINATIMISSRCTDS